MIVSVLWTEQFGPVAGFLCVVWILNRKKTGLNTLSLSRQNFTSFKHFHYVIDFFTINYRVYIYKIRTKLRCCWWLITWAHILKLTPPDETQFVFEVKKKLVLTDDTQSHRDIQRRTPVYNVIEFTAADVSEANKDEIYLTDLAGNCPQEIYLEIHRVLLRLPRTIPRPSLR